MYEGSWQGDRTWSKPAETAHRIYEDATWRYRQHIPLKQCQKTTQSGWTDERNAKGSCIHWQQLWMCENYKSFPLLIHSKFGFKLTDLHCVRAPMVPIHLSVIDRPFVPHNLIPAQWSPVPCWSSRWPPDLPFNVPWVQDKGTQICIFFFSQKSQ